MCSKEESIVGLAIDWQSCVCPVFIHGAQEHSPPGMRSSVLGSLSCFRPSLSRAISSLVINTCSLPSEYAAMGEP